MKKLLALVILVGMFNSILFADEGENSRVCDSMLKFKIMVDVGMKYPGSAADVFSCDFSENGNFVATGEMTSRVMGAPHMTCVYGYTYKYNSEDDTFQVQKTNFINCDIPILK